MDLAQDRMFLYHPMLAGHAMDISHRIIHQEIQDQTTQGQTTQGIISHPKRW
jgi:hypothetical protein